MAIAERAIFRIDMRNDRKFLHDFRSHRRRHLVTIAGQRFRPDHMVEHRHTRHTGIKRLALEATGISDNPLCLPGQPYGFQITDWRNQYHLRETLSDSQRPLPIARMHRINRRIVEA